MKSNFIWTGFIAVLALGMVVLFLQGVQNKPAGSVAGVQLGGAYTMVDHKGHPVTEKSWPDKYKLLFFGFTHCPGVCPDTLQKISVAIEKVDPEGKKLVPLFVTTDPARDTQGVMAAYVSRFNQNIVGLTGTESQVKGIEKAYKVFATKVPGAKPGEYMVDHSSYIYLMSPDDQLLEVMGADESAEGIIGKIRLHI